MIILCLILLYLYWTGRLHLLERIVGYAERLMFRINKRRILKNAMEKLKDNQVFIRRLAAIVIELLSDCKCSILRSQAPNYSNILVCNSANSSECTIYSYSSSNHTYTQHMQFIYPDKCVENESENEEVKAKNEQKLSNFKMIMKINVWTGFVHISYILGDSETKSL